MRETGRFGIALVIALALHGSMAVLHLPKPFSPVMLKIPSKRTLEVSFVGTKPDASVQARPGENEPAQPGKRQRPVEASPWVTAHPRDNHGQHRPPALAAAPSKRPQPAPETKSKKSVEKPAEDALPLRQRPERTADETEPDRTGRKQAGSVVPALPRYRGNPPPEYPLAARRRGCEGLVVLSVTVGTDGSARNVEVTHSSGHELLDRAALNTVRAWRFDPATHRGVPFVMTVEVPVRFELRDERW